MFANQHRVTHVKVEVCFYIWSVQHVETFKALYTKLLPIPSVIGTCANGTIVCCIGCFSILVETYLLLVTHFLPCRSFNRSWSLASHMKINVLACS